ncbi:hypothetical protein [Pseudomonas sp. 2FE]|uniref:hypothetical protein n=1 Tax=Pseudomonas sp. 2FE TaxID=2502190 RepID=UPI0010FA4A53|nr:hypothetical protein [Pseudomonas sp. 2FE]
MLDLDNLEQKARQAKCGPWHQIRAEYGHQIVIYSSEADSLGDEASEEDLSFMTSSNPDVMLELIRLARIGQQHLLEKEHQ